MMLIEKIRKNLVFRIATAQHRLLVGFPLSEIEAIAGNVAKATREAPSQPLVTYARMLIERSVTPNEFHLNGEQALLDRVAELQFRTLFDVGANIGTWAIHAAKTFPQADLHAFEIVPDTFLQLQIALPDNEKLYLNPFGLSDEAGNVPVNIYRSHYISSMFAQENVGEYSGQIQSEVRRGADYAESQEISRIDFLKIDVEGAEGKVLTGFQPMITQHRIRLIQFEYNRGALLGDFLLKNAYAFFGSLGYKLGKLLPNGVYFHDYKLIHEDFVGPNYVAIREDDRELERLISV